MSELSSNIVADTGDPGGPDLRGLGIMQLLKQASRRRGGSNSTSTTSAAAASTLPGASTPGGSLEMAIARLARGEMPSIPVSKPSSCVQSMVTVRITPAVVLARCRFS